MLAAFRALPLIWRVLSIVGGLVAIVGAIGGVYLSIDHQGYQRATLEWTIKYEKREAELKQQLADELARQAAINTEAKEAEEAELEQYRLRLREMATLAMQLTLEAAADPAANNIALDADAIARHKRRIQQ